MEKAIQVINKAIEELSPYYEDATASVMVHVLFEMMKQSPDFEEYMNQLYIRHVTGVKQ